jgi:hypothetical protein
MMRLVVIGVAAFLLSLGGTTGVLVTRGKAAAKVAADSAKAKSDSTEHGSAAPRKPAVPAGKTAGGPALGAGMAVAKHEPLPSAGPAAEPLAEVPAADSAHRAAGHQGADSLVAPAPSGLQATSAGGRAAGAPGADLSYRQLARIFSNMKTTDAVKVMAFMSDDEVQGVLEEVGVRQAAGLLAAFPKERAAALSRRLLHAGAPPVRAK